MDQHSPDRSRRSFLQSAVAVAAGTAAVASSARGADELLQPASAIKPSASTLPTDPWKGLKFGVASYSLRGMKIDAAIAAIQRVGLKWVSIKDIHIPLKSSPEERKAGVAKFKDAGIMPMSCGVVTMQNDEANCRAAFEYTRDLGVPVMVCNPHPQSFPILDKLVKEFDIKLAIHNHGPESDRFQSPYDAMKAAEKFDERIGLCIDVGHTGRMDLDPAEAIRKCAPRLYDIHFKDISQVARRNTEIEIGRGILNIKAMLQAMLEVKFAHHCGIEHEKDAKDPLPGLAESVGHSRGIMSCL